MKHMTLALAACAAIAAPTVIAQSTAEDLISYRQAVMSSIGADMGAISAIVRGKVSYGDHMAAHARSIHSSLTTLNDLFDPASADGETEALAAIWEKPEEFAEAVNASQEAAENFLATVEGGDASQFGRSFGALARTCSGCHDDFRIAQ